MNDVYLKLAEGVCFENYGEAVYLRNIDARKEYLFNEIVYDLLCCLRDGSQKTAAELGTELLKMYEAEDAEAFQTDIAAFADTLLQEGILQIAASPDGDPEITVDQQVQEICTRQHILHSACLELTYRCNERCIHCYADDAQYGDELKLEDYQKLLNELREMGCIKLLLTGGEVCRKSEFIQIAQHAASLGMLVDIFSNGIGIDDEMFDAIKALHPNSLSFSLYAGDAETHDAITRVKGSFEKTLRAIMMTKCAGIDTYIKTVVMRENVDHFEGLLKLGKRLGIPVTPGFAVLDTHSGCSGAKHRLEQLPEYQNAMDLVQQYQPRKIYEVARDPEGPICNAGRCSLSITPYGDVYPCLSMHIPMGNIREKSISEIWNHSDILDQIQRLRFCDVCKNAKNCENINHCELCLGSIGYLGSLEDVHILKENCIAAEASKNVSHKYQHPGKEE